MDVADERFAVAIGELEHGQQTGRVAGAGEAAALLDRVSHQRVATRLDILDVIDVVGMAVGAANDRRQTEVDVPGDRAIGLAALGIAVDAGIQERQDLAFQKSRIVERVPVGPNPVGEARGLQAPPGEGNHLRPARRPRRPMIEIGRFAGERVAAPGNDCFDVGDQLRPFPDRDPTLIVGDRPHVAEAVLAAERSVLVAPQNAAKQSPLDRRHVAIPARISADGLLEAATHRPRQHRHRKTLPPIRPILRRLGGGVAIPSRCASRRGWVAPERPSARKARKWSSWQPRSFVPIPASASRRGRGRTPP